MIRLLIILILTFSFQSLTKADDIKDFEIEGMSIGDSLLDHMSEVEINDSILKSKYKDNSFVRVETYNNLKSYDAIQLHFKNDDSNYIIHMLSGAKYFIDDIDNCYKEKKIAENDLKDLFKKLSFEDWGTAAHPVDKTGKTMVSTTMFTFIDSGSGAIQCYDWSKEMKYNDHLKIKLMTDEYSNWIQNIAFK
jgi:hypothetical protein